MATADTVTLLLTGDVMTGRGIDQVMPHPVSPELYEGWVRDARDYVRLAEQVNGPIAAPVPPDYVWGDALAEMDRLAPGARIVNLETAITRSGTPWPGKGIHYRMSPAHVGLLGAARIDACSLANNHVLDWGAAGLAETLATLRAAGVATAGAGATLDEAWAPAVLPLSSDSRALVYAAAGPDCGVPTEWAPDTRHGGVALLPRLDEPAVHAWAARVQSQRRAGDVVIASLHWGANWVDAVPQAHRRFAHRLIELGAADVVHGHSSHHPLPMEVHRGKPVLYGCGDLINDYEGIRPQKRHRSDLGCLYGLTLERSGGQLRALELVPLQARRLRLGPPDATLREALRGELNEGCSALGTRIDVEAGGRWLLRWDER